MISSIRKQLVDLIALHDPNLKQWSDWQNIDNIPATLLNKSYHIAYSLTSISKGQNNERYEISVQVRQFFGGQRDTIKLYDSSVDSAEALKDHLASDPLITPVSIDVESISSNNDNKIVTTINLTLIKYNCKE